MPGVDFSAPCHFFADEGGFSAFILKTHKGSFLLLGLLASVFYFSWLPDPALAHVKWLPAGLTSWADRHGRLRTAVPFAGLGLLAGLALARQGQPMLVWLRVWLLLAGVVVAAETGQLLIPRRVFDWRDIGWGMIGSLAGLFPGILVVWLRSGDGRFGTSSGRESQAGNITNVLTDLNGVEGLDDGRAPSVGADSAPVSAGLAVDCGYINDFLMVKDGSHPCFRFLGIPFWNGKAESLLVLADREGGLLTVPSAPSLAQMTSDPMLATSYRGSDWAVVDGGYVALIMRFVFGKSVTRISGLQLLQKLVAPGFAHAVPMERRRILWVVPNSREKDAIRNYLLSGGFDLNLQHFYEAPFYKKDSDFQDVALCEKVKAAEPQWIILCIGGGRQEKLGLFLRDTFNVPGKRPVILCTGGAISFLSGTQANIPTWADRLYLGWLLRIFTNPKLFGARYVEAAWKFPKLLWMCRGSLFVGKEVADGPSDSTTGSKSEIRK